MDEITRLQEVLRQEKEKNQKLEQELYSEKKLKKYFADEYVNTVNLYHALEQNAALYQAENDRIHSSLLWKAARPARGIYRRLRSLLRRSKICRKAYYALRYLKLYGFSKTLKKIFKKRETVQSAVYLADQLQAQRNARFPENITFSVLVPLYNTPEKYLREMILSVTAQTYGNWQLCLADGSDAAHPEVERICRGYAQKDSRICYRRLEKNEGIVGNTNHCAEFATGEYLAFLDHDDILAPFALFENAEAICKTNADILYSDEDHITESGEHINPLYKPDWSPDLLHSQMYICHLLVLRRSLFEKIGGFRAEYNGAQDYDLMLRLSEETDRICHIPQILYSWRETQSSTSVNADSKPYAHIAGLKALDAHLKRVYGENAYAEETPYRFVYHARFGLPEKQPLVSVLIPMKDKWELTEQCVRSILEKSTYQNYEILILDNNSAESETFAWFERISKEPHIRVEKADMPFNWSRINNYGISLARGEIVILLNNDTVVITPDWIERMTEEALRKDVGIVGALLRYEDKTIQHAGIVVGLKGWAEHIFKGMRAEHLGLYYISPMVTRNVSAVTGACFALSKKTLEKIGLLDEIFVICGSDVELCLRARQCGLYNIYDSTVQLYHLESKSRDSFVPEIDFEKSRKAYAAYLENGDPYFNVHLDLNSFVPQVIVPYREYRSFADYLKKHPRPTEEAPTAVDAKQYQVLEVTPLSIKSSERKNPPLRINLLVPSLNRQHVFGGIATALKFFRLLQQKCGCEARILVENSVNADEIVPLDGYCIVNDDHDYNFKLQIVSTSDRMNDSVFVHKNDIFMSTAWWTAYSIAPVIRWQAEHFGQTVKPLIYFIQDYEPGFYAWSSRYLMADSTYRLDIPTYAVFNSYLLRDFFRENRYSFAREWSFDPSLNDTLAEHLHKLPATIAKKKQLLVYGRPNTVRNAFELVVEALREWCKLCPDCREWTLLSAGETHPDINLGNCMTLHSVGKLTLEQYAKTLEETYAGISLMVSPHPSYPPLEMAAFGVKTITNTYSIKDMRSFSPNICSISNCSALNVASALKKLCDSYDGSAERMTSSPYLKKNEEFEQIAAEISDLISEK